MAALQRMACQKVMLALQLESKGLLSFVCTMLGKWIYGRCAGVKRAAAKFKKIYFRKSEVYIGEAVEQEEEL